MMAMQDCVDDDLRFGAPNIRVIDPWNHRGWRITNEGWLAATDGVMRTADRRVAMPLAEVPARVEPFDCVFAPWFAALFPTGRLRDVKRARTFLAASLEADA